MVKGYLQGVIEVFYPMFDLYDLHENASYCCIQAAVVKRVSSNE